MIRLYVSICVMIFSIFFCGGRLTHRFLLRVSKITISESNPWQTKAFFKTYFKFFAGSVRSEHSSTSSKNHIKNLYIYMYHWGVLLPDVPSATCLGTVVSYSGAMAACERSSRCDLKILGKQHQFQWMIMDDDHVFVCLNFILYIYTYTYIYIYIHMYIQYTIYI